jgi:hypothetical protein
MEEFTISWVLVRVFSGLIIGTVIGMTGVGGGVLVMPTLTFVLGLPASIAVGTASLYAFLTKCYAVFEHHRLKTISYGISLLFLLGALPGAVLSSLVVLRLANQDSAAAVQRFQSSLRMLIAWVMVFAATMLIINLIQRSKRSKKEIHQASEKVSSQAARQQLPWQKRITGLVAGLVVGLLIGSTSVGGGVLVVPLLVMLFGLSARQTVGSSILIAVVLTLITSLLYLRGGNLDLVTALIMWGGSLAGVFVGSRLAVRIPDRVLQGLVIVVICFATAMMFLKPGGGH